MSAEDNQVVDNGPTIFTVEGQEGHVSTAPVVEEVKVVTEPVTDKTEVVEVKKDTTAGSEEQVEQDNRDEKGRFKPTAKERIDELTRARRDAERDAEYWKSVAEGKIVPPAKAAAVEVKPNEAPTRDQFESEEDFLDALTDHKVEVKLAEREQQAEQNKAQTTKVETWQSKLAAARADIADFDSVMDAAELPVKPHVAELVMEHDHGAKVIHHLAMNPEQLEKINAMTPAKAAFAIAEIATQFNTAEATSPSKPAVVKKVSEAPPPAARNVGSGRSTTVPLGEQSMEDYIATRKTQGARWAR